MLAAAKGHVDVCKCLTRHGADVKAENQDRSDNVLTYACFAGNAEVIVHLINLGARVSYTNARYARGLVPAPSLSTAV